MQKLGFAAGMLAAAIAALPAGAVEITYSLGFDPGVGRDDAAAIPVDRFNNLSGAATNANSLSGGCWSDFPAVTSFGLFPPGQFMGAANDSVANVRLNPNGVQCYSVVSPSGGSAVTPNIVASGAGTDFGTSNTTDYIGYIGFHLGSVDSWNFIGLLDQDSAEVPLPGDTNGDLLLDGTEIAAAAGIAVDTATGTYVNIVLTAADRVQFIGWGNFYNNALEFTSLAWVTNYYSFTPFGFGIVPAPAPPAALLLPLGLAGLLLARRRR